VAATSVNPFDLKMRSGVFKDVIRLTFPAILGFDVSGVVEAVGPASRLLVAVTGSSPRRHKPTPRFALSRQLISSGFQLIWTLSMWPPCPQLRQLDPSWQILPLRRSQVGRFWSRAPTATLDVLLCLPPRTKVGSSSLEFGPHNWNTAGRQGRSRGCARR
jgi:hypothetical protein